MASNNFKPLYVTLEFAHNNHCYHHYCYYMMDNYAFGFSKYYFGIRTGFKKNIFCNSVKNETHIGYLISNQHLKGRVKKAFCITSIFRMYQN